MNERTFIIVGASLAGAKAAEELRAQGFDGRVVLLGSEPERPYERPPLSNDYCAGNRRGRRLTSMTRASVWDVNDQVQALIRIRRPADPCALSDPETSLESLTGEVMTGS